MTDDYDAVTARDIADFLDHLARLRLGGHDDPDGRAAFLTHKAQLLTRIADQHADTDPGYSQEVRQSADDARAAARRCTTGLPQQRVGPNHRRTPHRPPDPGGATSQKVTAQQLPGAGSQGCPSWSWRKMVRASRRCLCPVAR
jgi:hypothetical protein